MSGRDSTSKVSRRQFVVGVGASLASAELFPAGLRARQSPSDRVNIAAIGLGLMGPANLKECERENIVALCDVDRENASKTIARYPRATFYTDYREMLDKEKGIEAVVVATPDHTHAAITLASLQLGKHVYCQKPLAHTVADTRMIMEAARQYNVRTQMGNQGHSYESILLLKEWLDDGVIGEVTQVHAWTDRPVGGDPWSDFAVRGRPEEVVPVPPTLDWDRWIGPAPFRPYHPAYHPVRWRAWIDFGTGALGDMGCHILDPAFWALELGSPQSIEATSTHYDPAVASETYPRASIVRYSFPSRGRRPPVKLTWYDGRLLPPVPPELEPGRALPRSGALLIGQRGTILHGSHGAEGLRLIPEARMKEYPRPPRTLRRITEGHEGDWLRAIKEGPTGIPPCSSFEYGGALTEMVLLGVIAIRLKDQRLDWDGRSLRFTNNEAANALLRTSSVPRG